MQSLRNHSKISLGLLDKMIQMRMKKGTNFWHVNMDKTTTLMESNQTGSELLEIPDVLPSNFPVTNHRYLFTLSFIND